MTLTRIGIWSVACLLIALVSMAGARPIQPWSYKKLFRESDLVVIAEAVRTQASQDVFPDSNPGVSG